MSNLNVGAALVAAVSNTSSLPSKADRVRYGQQGKPIPATKAYVADMDHDSKDEHGVVTLKWILLTPGGRRVHLNTYNGVVGKGIDQNTFTYDMPDAKAWAKKIKDFKEVPIETCPFAISAIPAPVIPVGTEGETTEGETTEGETTGE